MTNVPGEQGRRLRQGWHRNVQGCLLDLFKDSKENQLFVYFGFDKLFLVKSVFTACILYFRFEANFGQQTVAVVFKCMGLPEVQPGQIRVLRKANKMEILV